MWPGNLALNYKISTILYQLGIYSKNHFQGAFPLLLRIVRGLQPSDRGTYHLLERGNIVVDGLSDAEEHDFEYSTRILEMLSPGSGNRRRGARRFCR
jgi:hypothetical protein